MKRLAVVVLSFVLGTGLGSTVRYPAAVQKAYRKGVSDGLDQCHREAVMTGHGRYTFTSADAPIGFAWLDALDDYHPETRIKGLPGDFID